MIGSELDEQFYFLSSLEIAAVNLGLITMTDWGICVSLVVVASTTGR